MNIGETIRNYRLQKGMSQGDIEKRTGLLRCYLSRVENGHTIPSLDTLAKIATAMDLLLHPNFQQSKLDLAKRSELTGILRRNDDASAIASREAIQIAYGPTNPYGRIPEIEKKLDAVPLAAATGRCVAQARRCT